MRIGILSDIHEDVRRLRRAISLLRHGGGHGEGVDQLVFLGDVFETGHAIDATVDLLTEAGVVGVWGNHELGLCHEPEPKVAARYSNRVNRFMQTLQPRLEIGPLLFNHGLPHWDPTDPTEYYVGSLPHEVGALKEIFATSDHDVMFVGHFHHWQIWNAHGEVTWDGQSPIDLPADERHLVVVDAVMGGACAVYDTAARRLMPMLFD